MKNTISQIGFWQYWRMVFCGALYRAWDKFGAWGTFIGIIAPIIAVVIARHPKSLADFLASDAVVSAELIVGLFVFVLMIYIIREPVFVYNKKQDYIETLEKTYIGPPADISLQKNVEQDTINFQWVGIKIYNPNFQKITNITVKLKLAGLWWINSTRGKIHRGNEIPESERVFYEGKDFDEKHTVPGRHTAYINLVRIENGKFLWLLNHRAQELYSDFETMRENFDLAVYEVNLSIEGLFDGKTPIVPHDYKVSIAFRIEKNANLKPIGFGYQRLDNPETVYTVLIREGEYEQEK